MQQDWTDGTFTIRGESHTIEEMVGEFEKLGVDSMDLFDLDAKKTPPSFVKAIATMAIIGAKADANVVIALVQFELGRRKRARYTEDLRRRRREDLDRVRRETPYRSDGCPKSPTGEHCHSDSIEHRRPCTFCGQLAPCLHCPGTGGDHDWSMGSCRFCGEDKTKDRASPGTDSAKTAEERGMELLNTPRGELPTLAVVFMERLQAEIGVCMEVTLTAFTVYAQCAEGLPCSDELYYARVKDEEWFNEQAKRFGGRVTR